MIKNSFLLALVASAALSGCQEGEKEHVTLSKEAIDIHDEIMPQISHFDRSSVKIDSILGNLDGIKSVNPELDTTNTRAELTSLQDNIESATHFMMEWMRSYEPDSADVAYQRNEVERVSTMRNQFDSVRTEINTKLQPFN